VKRHADYLSRLVGEAAPVYGVVVFTDARLAGAMPANVVTKRNLRRYLRQFKTKALSETLVESILSRIASARDTSRAARKQHVRRIAMRRATEYTE
jgi:hypothetical protein